MFSEQEIYDLTSDPTKEVIGSFRSGDRAPKNDCFCHVGQVGFSCTSSTLTVSGIPPKYEYQVTQGVCVRPRDCVGTQSGCGWFWYYSCNGSVCNFS
ncbi:MAG: hypothetical protein ACKO41_04040 [Sphingomonadales bacterium]